MTQAFKQGQFVQYAVPTCQAEAIMVFIVQGVGETCVHIAPINWKHGTVTPVETVSHSDVVPFGTVSR